MSSEVKSPKNSPKRDAFNRGRKLPSANPRPGRPTAARTQKINRAVMEAARKEFRARGYESVRMAAVAVRAGISKPTLYARYPTKEALFAAVANDRVSQWAKASTVDQGPMPADLQSRLKHRARKHMEYFETGRIQSFDRLLESAPLSPELRRLRHKVGHQSVVQVIAQDIVHSTRGEQQVPRGTALRIAEMLVILLHGWWRVQIEVGRVRIEEAQDFADYAVDVLLSGRTKWLHARSS